MGAAGVFAAGSSATSLPLYSTPSAWEAAPAAPDQADAQRFMRESTFCSVRSVVAAVMTAVVWTNWRQVGIGDIGASNRVQMQWDLTWLLLGAR